MTHSASSARAQPLDHGVGDGFANLLRSWREAGDARVPIVMGIVNVTPDSFSDGGQFFRTEAAIEHGLRLHDEGAVILDVGGESTRANAEPVAADEEIRRILPVIEALTANGILVSVDTMKAEVARAAISVGAQILNDVRGLLGDPEMAAVAARSGAGVIAMHNQGVFGSAKPMEIDPVAGCIAFFRRALDVARKAGVAEDRIVLDPGFGFGKSPEQNLQLLARFGELETLGLPLLAGTSRKSFIAKIAGADDTDRLAGTLATNVVAALAGAAIVRVHDVTEHVAAKRIAAAIRGADTSK
ncbi:dihydropteroate synthase [Afifella marina]|uniref:dihydropteroate synthase n=1 Tax=Afifella marina TaxID=1080 RepID=UPI000DABD515|nr:dihydropteroate synthase [Afifella marina]RAI22574.1 dihydropteroate synthase [Afifella marina DSM 2698]